MQPGRKWMYLAAVPMIAASIPGTAMLMGNGTRDSARVVEEDPSRFRLVADLSDRRLRMYEADSLLWQYPVAVGADGFETPVGTYSINKLIWNPRWVPPDSEWAKKYTPKRPGEPGNPMKVVKIFFKEPTYYIHGTGEINSLGSAASHGCLRMDPEHVAEVARYVMQYGGRAESDNWFMRVLRFRTEEKPIYLSQPVSLEVRR
ncbi:MAG: L,D-transpeptidase [Gemmatimonadaceae bacterium]